MGRLGRGWIGRYAALWAIGLGMPLMASAGWMIEQIEYANLGAEGTRTLQYISKNRLKTVGDGNTFIMDFAKICLSRPIKRIVCTGVARSTPTFKR